MPHQRWAVEQQPNPLAQAFSSRDRAGTCRNFGDVERGLVVVDRAIVAVQSALLGTADRDLAVGILNLRGMTLAGRLRDKAEGKREAQRHIDSAWGAAASFPSAMSTPMASPSGRRTRSRMSSRRRSTWAGRDALALNDDLDDALEGLPPTRVAPTRINAARAQLDLGDRDGALENLSLAFEAAPHYLFRGPAMGLPASGIGMAAPPCRTYGPGGGVTGPGGTDRPLIRGMTTDSSGGQGVSS